MSGTEDVSAAIAAQERAAEAARARVGVLEKRLSASVARRADLADLLGEGSDGLPLPTGPVYAALFGAVAANGALFFGFVLYLTRLHEIIWNACFVLAMIIGVGALPFSGRPGGGGRARLGLRRFAIAGLVLAAVGVATTILAAR